ncbi:MAG: hypothetical protein ABIN89_02565 [Chitinophagaceae bacterium]
MSDLLTIGFDFKNTFYYSLIRVKEKEPGIDYQVTVMNGNLEKLLYGNHIIKKVDGYLRIEMAEPTEQEMLKVSIAEALSTFLNIPLEISRAHCEA